MSYVLVTNKSDGLAGIVRENNQYFIRWENGQINKLFKGADGIITPEGYEVGKDEVIAVRIGIRNWTGGTREQVKEESEKVLKELTSTEELVYARILGVSTKVE